MPYYLPEIRKLQADNKALRAQVRDLMISLQAALLYIGDKDIAAAELIEDAIRRNL